MKIDCIGCDEKNCFIKICKDESVQKVNDLKIIQRQPKGQYVFKVGNPVYGIYIVKSGVVKVQSIGYNQKPFTIRLASNGQLFGHRGIGHKTYSVSAIAQEDSLLCYIESAVFDSLLRTDNSLAYELMMFYSKELGAAENRMKNLAQMTVREKVADLLLMIENNFGIEENNTTLLNIQLNRSELGEMVSISYEQITRTLSEFKKENIIEIENKKIKLCDKTKLKTILSPYYIND